MQMTDIHTKEGCTTRLGEINIGHTWSHTFPVSSNIAVNACAWVLRLNKNDSLTLVGQLVYCVVMIDIPGPITLYKTSNQLMMISADQYAKTRSDIPNSSITSTHIVHLFFID